MKRLILLSRRIQRLSVSPNCCFSAFDQGFEDPVRNHRGEEIPIITMPQKLIKKQQKLEHRKAEELKEFHRLYGIDKNRSNLVINCSNEVFNHYDGQCYPGPIIPLLSENWEKPKNIGAWMTIRPHGKNPSIMGNAMRDLPAETFFADLGIFSVLVKILENDLYWKSPTVIQAFAIQKVLSGKNTLIGAETGSGKTLAYLLPVIQQLLEWRCARQGDLKYDEKREERPKVKCMQPRALILTHGRQLVDQIFREALRFARKFPDISVESSLFKTPEEVGQAHRMRSLVRSLQKSEDEETLKPLIESAEIVEPDLAEGKVLLNDADLFIGTPGAVLNLLKSGQMKMDNLAHLVIDEADMLLGKLNLDKVLDILNRITFKYSAENPTAADGVQLVLSLATFPRDLTDVLAGYIDTNTLAHVKTPAMHAILPHVQQKFIRVSMLNKIDPLLSLLKRGATPGKIKDTFLIFVNCQTQGIWLENILRNSGLVCKTYYGKKMRAEKEEIMEAFNSRQLPILIATDRMVRGLDTTQVTHIVNFDFPRLLSDYVHRVGRVGRVGAIRSGKVTSFICRKSDVELMQMIELAARTTGQLPVIEESMLGDEEDEFHP